MKSRKLISTAVKSALLFAVGVGGAHAASFSSYLKFTNDPADANVIEDDSNEYLFRNTGCTTGPELGCINGYQLITTGNIQQNDLLLQVLDFPIINATDINALNDELTGIALNVVGALENERTIDPGGPALNPPAYTAVDFSMTAASQADWLALTGVDIGAGGLGAVFDTSNLIALLFFDTNNDLVVQTQGLGTTVLNPVPGGATATNGDLVFGLTLDPLSTPTNAIFVEGTPKSIDVFAPSPNNTPGVTQYGTFSYQLTIAYADLGPNAIATSGFTGTGTNLVTNRASIAAVLDDTQASFTATRVPEPASIGLVGLGLLSMGGAAMRRRRRS